MKSAEYKEHKDMMTQETTLVKTWGGFNLAIPKVKLNQLWKNQSFTIAT